MTPPRWYSHGAIARASGITRRYLRTLLDAGRIPFVQPANNAKRLLNDATVRGLEAIGIPVDRALLNAPALSANSSRFAFSTRDSENEA